VVCGRRQGLLALATRRIQSIGLFAMSESAIKRAVQHGEVKHMLLADHGLDIYANGIGAKDDFLQKNPEVGRRFVRASLRGWKDALANPEEAAQLQAQASRAAEFHHRALPEPYVSLSTHTAPSIRPFAYRSRQWGKSHGVRLTTPANHVRARFGRRRRRLNLR